MLQTGMTITQAVIVNLDTECKKVSNDVDYLVYSLTAQLALLMSKFIKMFCLCQY